MIVSLSSTTGGTALAVVPHLKIPKTNTTPKQAEGDQHETVQIPQPKDTQ
jgi:hypothetical protein